MTKKKKLMIRLRYFNKYYYFSIILTRVNEVILRKKMFEPFNEEVFTVVYNLQFVLMGKSKIYRLQFTNCRTGSNGYTHTADILRQNQNNFNL